MKRRAVVALAFALVATPEATSLAVETVREDDGDGTYGRFDGDVGLVFGAGATFGPRSPRATLDARVRYLSTAGLFATYEDGPVVGSSAEPRRAFAFGVEVRPLFLARWARNLQIGSPRLDLAIDSFGLELGGVVLQPSGEHFGARTALQAGIGLELPIFPSATGLFLTMRGGARWSDEVLAGAPPVGPSDRSLYFTLGLAWQELLRAHVVDLGDRRR